MSFQSGSVIVCLFLAQVAADTGGNITDTLLTQVSLISEKLNTNEANIADLKADVSLILTKLNEQGLSQSWNQETCVKGQPPGNGTKRITLWGNTTALCDTTTDEGAWVIIQRRINDDTDFYRGWREYRSFFGDLDTNFWIGNNAINRLTSEGYNELRIDMIYSGRRFYARYSNFYVATESLNYQMTVSGFSGTAADSFSQHNNMNFSTFDRDNDKFGTNCAVAYKGAWWYDACHYSNLNGLWGVDSTNGAVWYSSAGFRTVSFTEMKVRRV